MKVRPIFAWYDMWVGFFWDRGKKRLYILPVPMIGIVINFNQKSKEEFYCDCGQKLEHRNEVMWGKCDACMFHKGEQQ